MKKAIALLTVLLLALSLFACGDNETDIYTAPEDTKTVDSQKASDENGGNTEITVEENGENDNYTKNY